MAVSVVEQILARVHTILLSSTAAGQRVYRARDDAFGEAETPAINIRRGSTDSAAIGDSGDRVVVSWTLEFLVRGQQVETMADALHMDAHAVLMSDAVLSGMGRGLRCVGTDIETESRETQEAKLTARYQAQVFVRPDDLTRTIS